MSPRYVALAPIVAQMRTHVRVAAAALILGRPRRRLRTHHTGHRRDDDRAGTADRIAFADTVDGDPDCRISPDCRTFELPQIPGFPMPGGTDVPEVPAPPNALTMTCSEYTDFDEATQLAVIRAILAQERNPLGDRRPRCRA